MNLLISGELSAPPSEVSAFRTLTLYATMFKHMDCLVEVKKEEVDFYYKWLRNKYALDFVKQFVVLGEEKGYRLQYSSIHKITYNNLDTLISVINKI